MSFQYRMGELIFFSSHFNNTNENDILSQKTIRTYNIFMFLKIVEILKAKFDSCHLFSEFFKLVEFFYQVIMIKILSNIIKKEYVFIDTELCELFILRYLTNYVIQDFTLNIYNIYFFF